MQHVISACPVLTKEQYVQRHDRLCAELHFNIQICTEIGVKLDNKQQYDHALKSVETSYDGNVSVLWNQQLLTDRTIPNNKPDIVIRDDKQGTCMLTFRHRASCI